MIPPWMCHIVIVQGILCTATFFLILALAMPYWSWQSGESENSMGLFSVCGVSHGAKICMSFSVGEPDAKVVATRAVEIIGVLVAFTGIVIGFVHLYRLKNGTATKLYANIVAAISGFAAMFVLSGSIVYHVFYNEINVENNLDLGVCYYLNHLSFVLFLIAAILFWRIRMLKRDDQTVIIDSNSFDPSITPPVAPQYGYRMHQPSNFEVRGTGYVLHQPQNAAQPYMTMPNQPPLHQHGATGYGPDYGIPPTYNSSAIPQGRLGYASSKTQTPSNTQQGPTPPPYKEN